MPNIEASELSSIALRADYTGYYQKHVSDSPFPSRMMLSQAVIRRVSQRAREGLFTVVVDIGAGKQIFERELLQEPSIALLDGCFNIITLDIADIDETQLLASQFLHLQSDGRHLPLRTSSADLIISSSALDFMGEKAFAEASRVLAPDGTFLATFHHPSLVSIAAQLLPTLEHAVINANRSYLTAQRYGSSRTNAKRAKLHSLQGQLHDARFIVNELSKIMFQSTEQIVTTLQSHFGERNIKVSEHKGAGGENGWYFAIISRDLMI